MNIISQSTCPDCGKSYYSYTTCGCSERDKTLDEVIEVLDRKCIKEEARLEVYEWAINKIKEMKDEGRHNT